MGLVCVSVGLQGVNWGRRDFVCVFEGVSEGA